MATRSIVTSQPDVACDVCDRRLLRGEQPDVFLAAGRRRTVCELCAPRAVHEGWLRETEHQAVSLPAMRPRRGRSFFERLRQVGRPASGEGEAASLGDLHADGADPRLAAEPYGERPQDGELQPYDFLDSQGGGVAATAASMLPSRPGARGAGAPGGAGELSPIHGASAAASGLEQAIAIFNAGEYPRRIAGVARSLGSPEVSVRSAEHAKSVIVILIAWELCWYRYSVDLDEQEHGARLLAQGTELAELGDEERPANAFAADSGALSLTAI